MYDISDGCTLADLYNFYYGLINMKDYEKYALAVLAIASAAAAENTPQSTLAGSAQGGMIGGIVGAGIGLKIGSNTFGTGRPGDGAFHIPGNFIMGVVGTGLGGVIGTSIGATVGGVRAYQSAQEIVTHTAPALADVDLPQYKNIPAATPAFHDISIDPVIALATTATLLASIYVAYSACQGNFIGNRHRSTAYHPPLQPKQRALQQQQKSDQVALTNALPEKIQETGAQLAQAIITDVQKAGQGNSKKTPQEIFEQSVKEYIKSTQSNAHVIKQFDYKAFGEAIKGLNPDSKNALTDTSKRAIASTSQCLHQGVLATEQQLGHGR